MAWKSKSLLSIILLIIFFLSINSTVEANPKIVKDIEAKGGPLGLAIDEKNQRLFALNYSDGTLSVIKEGDFSLIKRIPLNKKIDANLDTRSVAYDAALNRIYVATGHDCALVLDGSTYEILFGIEDKMGKRFIADIALGDNHLYLLDWYGYIHKYDRTGKLEASIKIMDSSYMHRGPLGRLYLTSGNKGLGVVDGRKEKVIAVVSVPVNILSIPASAPNTIYAAGPGKLYAIDAKSLKVKKTIDVDYPARGGLGMDINPNTNHLFLVTSEDTVTVIDTKKGEKIDKLKVCKGPRSIAISKVTNTVYVACPNSDTITVIKDASQ